MELAYRLAVDDSPYIKAIREGMITLITPVVEVDGRDRMVDIYNWHLAHPKENTPPLMYWGHYVAHDNNRDAMGLSLKLTRNVLNTFTGWKAQVLHDLHESVPYLYDNTVGDGPYNAWVDPILADEWQMIGWNNVSEMTKFGMPGVFAHGNFDTWSPGYLFFDRRRRITASPGFTKRLAMAAPTQWCALFLPTSIRARGIARTRRCRALGGRSATTITTKRRRCSSRSTTSTRTANSSSRTFI